MSCPLDILHYQVVHSVLRANIVETADVGMVQAGNGAAFSLEPLTASWIEAYVGGQNLQGDTAVQTCILRLIDFTTIPPAPTKATIS